MLVALLIIAGLLVLLVALLVIRAALWRPDDTPVALAGHEEVDEEGVVRRLAGLVRLRTISRPDPAAVDESEFLRLHHYLEEHYPLVRERLQRETVDGLSLLYRWQGRDPDREPIALLSHTDVVPVTPGTEGDWHHDPFGGETDEEFVWGRGALDMKGHLIAVVEAVEHLLAGGYRPVRDIYLCFGHNEEVMGSGGNGAAAIAETLDSRGIRLGCVVDEGGMVVPGVSFAVDQPVALVGICEKGYMDVEMRLNDPGGHASRPPASTGLGRMSAAVVRLEHSPAKTRLTEPVRSMFRAIAAHGGFGLRLIVANEWLLRPLLLTALARNSLTNAMVRTTTAATMAEASAAANVLPQITKFTINCRILPGESVAGTLGRIERIVGDERIEYSVLRRREPSRVSDVDSAAWHALRKTIGELFGEVIVAPYLLIGGTDSRNYEPVCERIFRFSPFLMQPEDLDLLHGTNERISRENLVRGARFFMRLIRNLNAEKE